jgi:hypothetical protein
LSCVDDDREEANYVNTRIGVEDAELESTSLGNDIGHNNKVRTDYKELHTTAKVLQKVTKWVIERGILDHYTRARDFL